MTPPAVVHARTPAAEPVVRLPTYFGPERQPLFGWVHAPAAGSTRDMAAVICPSVGPEYINAHRSLRHLADQVAVAGMCAVRFDYAGTGDSAGADEAWPCLDAWLDSVRAALALARDASGADRMVLIGLRLGALLAAKVAHETAVSGLVLWAPCLSGRRFFRELRALNLAARPGTTTVPSESGTGTLRGDLQRELEALDLQHLTPKADRVLMAERRDLPEGEGLATQWRRAHLVVERRMFDGFGTMVCAPHHTEVPTSAIGEMVQWIADDGRPMVHRRAASGQRALTGQRVSNPATSEAILSFGPRSTMFGVVTERRGASVTAPTVILSNAGSVHHVGPNGLYVDLARSLSNAGFRVFRFDMPGLGDSPADEGVPENRPYPSDATAILASAMDALDRRYGSGRFVLMGLCSGAHASFHAAAELRSHAVVEAVLINPLTFQYQDGMSLDAPSAPHVGRWQRYRQSMATPGGWAKLLRPEVRFGQLARDTVLTAARKCGFPRLAGEPSAAESALRRLSSQGRRLTLVCSRYEPGYALLMHEARRAARAMKREGMLETWFVDDANHTFDSPRGRAALVSSITGALGRRYSNRVS
jgi:alpha-beta hydrolase superfamily lysophospholipase